MSLPRCPRPWAVSGGSYLGQRLHRFRASHSSSPVPAFPCTLEQSRCPSDDFLLLPPQKDVSRYEPPEDTAAGSDKAGVRTSRVAGLTVSLHSLQSPSADFTTDRGRARALGHTCSASLGLPGPGGDRCVRSSVLTLAPGQGQHYIRDPTLVQALAGHRRPCHLLRQLQPVDCGSLSSPSEVLLLELASQDPRDPQRVRVVS